jgi:hypothetical protein
LTKPEKLVKLIKRTLSGEPDLENHPGPHRGLLHGCQASHGTGVARH